MTGACIGTPCLFVAQEWMRAPCRQTEITNLNITLTTVGRVQLDPRPRFLIFIYAFSNGHCDSSATPLRNREIEKCDTCFLQPWDLMLGDLLSPSPPAEKATAREVLPTANWMCRRAISAIIPSHSGGRHIPDTAYTAYGTDVRILQ